MKSGIAKPAKSTRPVLPKISEEMKAYSAALAVELADWPGTSTRTFFGFTALYCRDRIFAALPRTRAMGTPNSLAFKLPEASPRIVALLKADARIGSTQMQKARWFTFELSSADDLQGAMEWLSRAYEAARRTKGKGATI